MSPFVNIFTACHCRYGTHFQHTIHFPQWKNWIFVGRPKTCLLNKKHDLWVDEGTYAFLPEWSDLHLNKPVPMYFGNLQSSAHRRRQCQDRACLIKWRMHSSQNLWQTIPGCRINLTECTARGRQGQRQPHNCCKVTWTITEGVLYTLQTALSTRL